MIRKSIWQVCGVGKDSAGSGSAGMVASGSGLAAGQYRLVWGLVVSTSQNSLFSLSHYSTHCSSALLSFSAGLL